jgi:hypothetical protein
MSNDGLEFDDGGGAVGQRLGTGPCPVGPEGTIGEPGVHDVYSLLAEIANIDDEIARLNIDKLIKRSADRKKALKEMMIAQKQEHIVDEITRYTADIIVRTNDTWDIELFKTALKDNKYKYIEIRESFNIGAIEHAIKSGDLSRAQLEVAGAVKKSLASLALYVKAPKKDET